MLLIDFSEIKIEPTLHVASSYISLLYSLGFITRMCISIAIAYTQAMVATLITCSLIIVVHVAQGHVAHILLTGFKFFVKR